MNALRFVEHCIDTYADRAWRMAYALLSNTHDADDLLQQAFVIAWRKADQAPRDNPWPWLAAIIAGEAYNARRKRSRRTAAPLDQAGDPAMQANQQRELEQAELHALVYLALNQLSPEHRIAIVLTHLSGLTQEQAAKAVGVPLDTLKARVRRGMDKLREVVRADDGKIEKLLLTLPAAFGIGGLSALKAGWFSAVEAEAALAATATAAAGASKALYLAAAGLVLTVGLIAVVAWNHDTPAPPLEAASRAQAPREPSAEPKAEYKHNTSVMTTGPWPPERVTIELPDDFVFPSDSPVSDEPPQQRNPGMIGSVEPPSDQASKQAEIPVQDTSIPGRMVYRAFPKPIAPAERDVGVKHLEKLFVDLRSSRLEAHRALMAADLSDDSRMRLVQALNDPMPWQTRAEFVQRIIATDDQAWLKRLYEWVTDKRNVVRFPLAAECVIYALMNHANFQTLDAFEQFAEIARNAAQSDRRGDAVGVILRIAHELGDVAKDKSVSAVERVKMLVAIHESIRSPEATIAKAVIRAGVERLTGHRSVDDGQMSTDDIGIALILKPKEYRSVFERATALEHDGLRLDATSRNCGWPGGEIVVLPDFGLNFDLCDPHLALLNRGRNCLFVDLPTRPDHKGVERVGEDAFDMPIDKIIEALEGRRVAQGGGKIGIIAHGLSGWIAMEYMKRYPDSISFAVMIGTWMGDDLEHAVSRLAKSKDPGLKLVAEQMTGSALHNDAQLFDYCTADADRYRVSGSTSLSLALRAAKCEGNGRVLVPKFEAGKAPWDGLSEVTVPRLVVWGEGDPMYVEPDSRLASGSRVETIKGAGSRDPWAESPGNFKSALDEFLTKHGIR